MYAHLSACEVCCYLFAISIKSKRLGKKLIKDQNIEFQNITIYGTYRIFIAGMGIPISEFYLRAGLHFGQGKGKVVPVHSMKAYGGSGSRISLILNLGTRWKLVLRASAV